MLHENAPAPSLPASALPEAAHICPVCGGANAADAVFCANPDCRKALGEFAYTPEEVRKETSWHEALADRVTLWIGKPQFLGIHLLWFLLWVMVNTGVLIMAPRFDAPPFSLLGILLSMEAIFVTGFLLISQNRQSRRDAKQAELDYEVNVRTFRKIAQMERTLQQVLEKLEAREKDSA